MTAARERKRILLVDDHPFMRAGVGQLINQQADLQLGGEAGHPADAAKLLAEGRWDLLMTDITMPGRSGLDFIKDVHALHPTLPILVVSMHDENIYAERALRAGARGYIMKEAGADKLLEAVHRVLSGSVYVSAELSSRIVDALSGGKPRGSTSPLAKLTDREFEIFWLIGQGKGTREIASQLHLSSKTVDVHRSHIKEKLALSDATALVRHAVRWVESSGQDAGA